MGWKSQGVRGEMLEAKDLEAVATEICRHSTFGIDPSRCYTLHFADILLYSDSTNIALLQSRIESIKSLRHLTPLPLSFSISSLSPFERRS
jgi:hypothetical protein